MTTVAAPTQKQHLQNVLPEKFLHGFGALRWIPYVFIDVVNKVNRKKAVQQRVLLVTDAHVYSCLPNDGDVQRCFPVAEITDIFVYQRGNEVGIKCPADYDYLCQLKSAASLQAFLSVMEGRNIVQCNTPVQQSHTLQLEKPAQYQKVTPAPLTITFNRCHRNLARYQQTGPAMASPKTGGKGSIAASPKFAASTSFAAETAGGQQQEGSPQHARELKFDDNAVQSAASPPPVSYSPEAAVQSKFEKEVSTNWKEVKTEEGDSSLVQSPSIVGGRQQSGASFGSGKRSTAASEFAEFESTSGGGSPSASRQHSQQMVSSFSGQNKELMTPVGSPRVPITPRVREDGSTLSLEEMLHFERARNIQYRRMMAELIASERESSATLRQVIDDLRAEVERLSVENMKLKHPTLEF